MLNNIIHEEYKTVKHTEAESRMMVARDWGEGQWGSISQGYKVSVIQGE